MSKEFIANKIYQKLEAAFNPIHIDLIDESDQHIGHVGHTGQVLSHVRLVLISDFFKDKNRLARQRAVFQVLKTEMETHIHALSLTLQTPEEANS